MEARERLAMRRIAVLITALVLLGGCGTTGPSLADSIVGNWVTDLDGMYVVIQDDGTYGVGHSLELAAPSDASTAELDWGTWSTDGNVLTQTGDGGACTGIVGTYEIDVPDDGNRLEVTVLDDACPSRRVDFGSGLTRHIDAGS